MGLVAYKRGHRGILVPSAVGGHSTKLPSMNQEEDPSPEYNHDGMLVFKVASKTTNSKYPLFISYTVHDTLLRQPEWTKTMILLDWVYQETRECLSPFPISKSMVAF